MQVEEEQGIGVYEDDRTGLNVEDEEEEFCDLLQWSHESSLPVSMTIVTFCGGVPTVSETVRLTLCRKGSLSGDLRTDPGGITWVLRGRIRAGFSEEQSSEY